jgi:polysaccharide biosynthesis protein PslH
MDNRQLSIVSIIPYQILPAKLGGEKGIAVFNEYLAQRVKLTGVTTENNNPSLVKGYKLLNIISNSRWRYANLLLVSRIKEIMQEEKANFLITEHPYYGWLAWMIRKKTGVKWIVHSHNIEYMRSRSIGRKWWKALKWYEQWVYRKADLVFFISEDDLEHAVRHMEVNREKALAVTYGIETRELPSDRAQAKKSVSKQHGISEDEKIFLFNGALYHSTNYDALKVILDEINPYLLANQNLRYKIIVCGKGLPSFFNDLHEYVDKNIIYAGFVDDISAYFKAADIFLNPILAGGGVKTKAIEAIAMDCTVISTELGALGLERSVCGNKLKVVKAGEWKLFTEAIVQASFESGHTQREFYDYYYWGNITTRVLEFLKRANA